MNESRKMVVAFVISVYPLVLHSSDPRLSLQVIQKIFTFIDLHGFMALRPKAGNCVCRSSIILPLKAAAVA